MKVSYVVLAGGRSKRFGADKLLFQYEGEPILRRVCKVLESVAGEVYVIVNDSERAKSFSEILNGINAKMLVDLPSLCEGPLKGIATVALSIECDALLVLPGDMPRVNSSLIEGFVRRYVDSEACSASLVWGDGSVEALIQIHRRDYVLEVVEEICSRKRVTKRATDLLRASRSLLLVSVKTLTNDATSLLNVNEPADVSSLRTRGRLEGHLEGDLVLELGRGSYYWRALEALDEGGLIEAKSLYEEEGTFYSEKGVTLLAEHAIADAKLIEELLRR